VENEASLQLQFSSIIKDVGELLVWSADELFTIELEKPVSLSIGNFGKSKTNKAKIDIFFTFQDRSNKVIHACAVELKFFKKNNHREPNNRYDVFSDISNLECYGEVAEHCYLVIATDHDHYVDQSEYSADTADFDFRDGSKYVDGTHLEYRTSTPYGEPITLTSSYEFSWERVTGGINFLKLAVDPTG
jgi:hypothetical protein